MISFPKLVLNFNLGVDYNVDSIFNNTSGWKRSAPGNGQKSRLEGCRDLKRHRSHGNAVLRSDVGFSPIEDTNQPQRWNIKDRIWHLTYNTQTS